MVSLFIITKWSALLLLAGFVAIVLWKLATGSVALDQLFATAAGPATDRAPLQAMGEGSIVSLQGFVKIARQEGAESVNCGKNVANIASNHDIHISIVDSPGAEECSGVVVEMIPHHRPDSWTPANVNEVAKANLLVRVTGQLMFDSSHTPCRNGTSIQGDPKRSSLWEVHPIYEFDVCPEGNCSSGTGWVPLEQFVTKQELESLSERKPPNDIAFSR
jgi:hypothetical protein